jgi:hypothetical protein
MKINGLQQEIMSFISTDSTAEHYDIDPLRVNKHTNKYKKSYG